jgi:hypothetical protein
VKEWQRTIHTAAQETKAGLKTAAERTIWERIKLPEPGLRTLLPRDQYYQLHFAGTARSGGPRTGQEAEPQRRVRAALQASGSLVPRRASIVVRP